MSVTDERAHKERRETGHLGGNSGSLDSRNLMPVRQKQKSGDYKKADGQRQHLRTRNESSGVSNQANQRKGAYSSE